MNRTLRVAGIGALLVVAACSTSDDSDDSDPSEVTSPTASAVGGEQVVQLGADAELDEIVAALPIPDEVEPTAERACERYGHACTPLDATDEQLDATSAAMADVDAAMSSSDDAREQLRLGLLALLELDGVDHVELDDTNATMLAFTIDDGPKAAVFTVASEPQVGGEVVAIDETFAPEAVGPQGFASTVHPQRYRPAGGPTVSRSAGVYNPFDWDSAAEIAAIFAAEDDYGTVDVFDGADVTPFTIDRVVGYDAVHIITHGGGSCPAWTDDRSECSSSFVGGAFDVELMQQQAAAADVNVDLDFFMCNSGGVDRYCFKSNRFPSNPDGIVFFGSCGSDFGFNTTGAGASVGWTGTTQQLVAERTAKRFWELMVTEGVEFELAKELVQGGGYDSHTTTFWASGGSVNTFTSAEFQGKNLRARDVVEMAVDGAEPRGQTLQFDGTPQDGQPELVPAKEQQVTFTVEGVRSGTEAGVTIEVRGDGEVWPSDITLADDGIVIEEGDGFATWRVSLDPGELQIPDVAWSDLEPTAAPVDIEVRAFQDTSEYTAYLGSVRLATDVEFTGPLPIFTELEAGLPANGRLEGNDLRVQINTGTGELTGSMLVELYGSGIQVGEWRLDLVGTYDAASGAVQGDITGTAEGGFGSIRAGEAGGGTFQGTANLAAETISIALSISGTSQAYVGTVVS
jgi:hypothetical protein